MIQPNELRLGNWVLINGHVSEIVGIGLNEAEYALKGISITPIDYDELTPIPLTEDLLLKCGFDTIQDGWYHLYLKNRIITWNLYDNKLRIDGIQTNHIKSLHQLQNLYFALTGDELNVEL
jgi:hypothetical protein